MNESNRPARLSIVTPFYNEGPDVARFLDHLTKVLDRLDLPWSVVCVNDGSRDDTIERLIEAHRRDSRIKVIDFSRNFGKEYALTAGLDHTGDDVVVLMDSDLQHPPEMLPAMLAKWREGNEVVYMVRQVRGDVGLLGKLGRRFFYAVFRMASDVRLPPEAGDFRLLDPVVVQAIRRMPERTRFMKGIYHWVGFRQVGLSYDEGVRKDGRSRWGFWRLTALAIDGITAFSNLPLRLWGILGAIIAGVSLVYGISRIIRTFIYGIDVPGFESLIVSVMFLGGIQLLSLGVLGGYIGRIFNEVKARPLYIVRRTYGLEQPVQLGLETAGSIDKVER
ncbi:MAG TPA: glycosyltransferase family 2 protein [Dongiaceae bacterium]|jgi:glycosyltransferase involved in cell wall biosynthesis|nr:glycosyltransferase family 2 protein [Dongiaceae bacterium]